MLVVLQCVKHFETLELNLLFLFLSVFSKCNSSLFCSQLFSKSDTYTDLKRRRTWANDGNKRHCPLLLLVLCSLTPCPGLLPWAVSTGLRLPHLSLQDLALRTTSMPQNWPAPPWEAGLGQDVPRLGTRFLSHKLLSGRQRHTPTSWCLVHCLWLPFW